ncbi:hypothetical protein VEE42_34770 [Escherichia coli]|nr:hypothetical protein VEE42_34770 [Escherichia coli]
MGVVLPARRCLFRYRWRHKVSVRLRKEEFAVIVKATRCKTVQRLAAEDNALKTGADALNA